MIEIWNLAVCIISPVIFGSWVLADYLYAGVEATSTKRKQEVWFSLKGFAGVALSMGITLGYLLIAGRWITETGEQFQAFAPYVFSGGLLLIVVGPILVLRMKWGSSFLLRRPSGKKKRRKPKAKAAQRRYADNSPAYSASFDSFDSGGGSCD